jgi:outer membrane protein assembly factor BamB
VNHQNTLACLAATLLIWAPAEAQRNYYRSDGGHSSKVRVPDDPAREPLEVAKTALSGGDLDRALSVYQDILDKLADRVAAVYVAPRTPNDTDHVLPGDRFSGLREHVAKLIRAIPDGLTRYREREGPRAAADLARAIAARDENELRRIATRWELTESGPLALAALADILFQSGRVTEARLCADRLLAAVDDPSRPAELRARAAVRAAVARAVLGDGEGLKDLAALPGTGDASLSVTWRGTKMPLSTVIEKLSADAEKIKPPPPLEKSLASFAKAAWQSNPPFARHDSRDDDGWQGGWQTYSQVYSGSYLPVIPAVSDSAVYVCDGIRVQGFSLTNGAPLWPPVNSPFDDFQGSRQPNLLHEVVLDRGVIYACLEDHPDIKAERHQQVMGFRPRETIAVRKLYAIDAATGEIKWSHASQEASGDPQDREFFDRISINTAPLILGDRIYVGATYYAGGFREWLCAFDRNTGNLVWKTYIAQGQAELNMFGNPIKETVPGYVGEHEGLLVYATNIGVVAAVDAITGAPRWISAYQQEPLPSSDTQHTRHRAPGWVVARPVFHSGKAIIAPSDAWDVYVFNLETGEGRAIPGARRTPSNQLRYVVGIHEDALILAGRKVVAFDLKGLASGQDPRIKWEAPPDAALTAAAVIEGRPAVAGDRLFYTGRGNSGSRSRIAAYVASIDVRSGRMLEEKQIEGVPFRGNIVFSPDAVVVAGNELTVMFDAKDVARRIEAAIKASPDDPELWLRSGQLALQERGYEKAIAELDKARTLAAAEGMRGDLVAGAATRTLFNLLLDLAGESVEVPGLPTNPKDRFEKALTYAANARQQVQVLVRELLWARKASKPALVREICTRLLAEFPEEKVRVDLEVTVVPELLRGAETKAGLLAALMGAATLAEADEHAQAVGFYQQALSRFPEDLVASPTGTTSVWRHAYGKIADIVQKKGPAAYAAEERAAAALFEEGRKNGNLDALHTLFDRYPNSTHVERGWLELSRRLRDAGKDREALRAVQRQLARYGTVTPALLFELARSLESLGAIESARDVLITLKNRFAKETLPTQSGPVGVAKAVDERLSGDAYNPFLAPPVLPEGTLGLKPGWTESPAQPGDEVVLVVPQGRRPKAADPYALIHKDGELRAIEIETGRIRWNKPARSIGEPVRPVWHDGRLLAMIDGELTSLDPANGKEHWRSSAFQSRVLALHAAHGKAYLMLRQALGGRTVTIRALDIVAGEKLRELEFALGSGAPGDQASFSSSPLWLLCVLDAGTGSSVVLDGVTGEPVLRQATIAALPPILTANNLLVTQASAGSSNAVSIVARNPKTQQVVWNFKLDRVSFPLGPIAFTPELAAFSVRFSGGTSGLRREIIVLDLQAGTTRMAVPLRPQDVTEAGVFAGTTLLVKVNLTDGKRFIRAYDVEKSSLLWDSVTYSGLGLMPLSIHPTRNFTIVRASARETPEKRTDTIHFFENRTGLLKDSMTLENTLHRPDQADVDVRDRTLILKGGPEVSVRK